MVFLLNKKLIIWLITGLTLDLVFGQPSRNTRQISGAVVSNAIVCADVGGSILQDGGSAVDAAIATLICEGIIMPQAMGVGGGFVGTIYTRETRKVETIIAREWAPAKAHKDMFVGEKKVSGVLSGAVPGAILGYWEMHQKYGRLPWKHLFQPSIKLAREGYMVTGYLADAIQHMLTPIRNDPGLSQIFLKENGEPYVENDYAKRPTLAKTLERIANNGAGELYDGGETAVNFVEDIAKLGGIITMDDLKQFKVQWESEGHASANITGGFTLYSTPLPTSGSLLVFILNIIKGMSTSNENVYWQRVIEAFKHSFGQRSNLGDYRNDPVMGESIKQHLEKLRGNELVEKVRKLIHDDRTSQDFDYYGADFTVEPDHGTAHMNVLACNGDAVAITSTINDHFGSKLASPQTGIILNNQMDDFCTPGILNYYGVRSSPANYIYPHKRPMSSTNPSIIVDGNGDVRMLVGSAGGTKITTAVATTIIKYLIRRENLSQAINEGRIHHQLFPMYLEYEVGVKNETLDYLGKVGHVIPDYQNRAEFASVTAIGVLNEPEPVFDRRSGGSTFTIKRTNKMHH